MSRKIVFIADDFGLNDSVNEAMIHGHRHGVLTGAALMFGQAGSEQAVELAKDNPELEVGWHLHVVDSKPMSCDEWPWKTPTAAGFSIGFSRKARDLVRKEIELQWNEFLKSGLRCSFVNTHHHLCIHPFVRKTLLETLGKDYDGWLRWGRPRFFGPKQAGYGILDNLLQAPQRARIPFEQSSTLWGIDRTFAMNADEVVAVIPTLGDGLHEFMFHPRQIEADKDTQCLVALKNMNNSNGVSPAL
jgi:predicted glycoside hydrolase/deacetylase ChbG (UPF0249 family)